MYIYINLFCSINIKVIFAVSQTYAQDKRPNKQKRNKDKEHIAGFTQNESTKYLLLSLFVQFVRYQVQLCLNTQIIQTAC